MVDKTKSDNLRFKSNMIGYKYPALGTQNIQNLNTILFIFP